MCEHTVPDAVSFLVDARSNLTVVRRIYGRRSARYQRLVRHYRRVADLLGCRGALERLAHPLRRPVPRAAPPLRAGARNQISTDGPGS